MDKLCVTLLKSVDFVLLDFLHLIDCLLLQLLPFVVVAVVDVV